MQKCICAAVAPHYANSDVKLFRKTFRKYFNFEHSTVEFVAQPQTSLLCYAMDGDLDIDPQDLLAVCHMEEEITVGGLDSSTLISPLH